MSVGVIFIRSFFALVTCEKHHKIGHEVREGMNPVGDQALGSGQQSDDDLGCG